MRSEEGREESLIESSAIEAKSELEIQVSKLKVAIDVAKRDEGKAKKAYDNAKYAVPFSLSKLDAAEREYNEAKEEHASLKDDLKNRQALLKELF